MKRASPVALPILLTGLAGCSHKAAVAIPADGMSWQSIRELPDFSGWWIWDYAATHDFPAAYAGADMNLQAAARKPEIQARDKLENARIGALFAHAQASDASYEAGTALTAALSQSYCTPPHFLGSNASEGSMEFLFTPGRVTMINEEGLVRRIALNQILPTEVADSNAGTSVGHWEDRTLVVETTGFDSEYLLAGDRIGRSAHSIERIRLKASNALQIDVTMTMPGLLADPFKHTYLFRRDPGHQFTDATRCHTHDRSIDPVTHKDRFDNTPPPDLPPPPKE